jgi:hypothetical protein
MDISRQNYQNLIIETQIFPSIPVIAILLNTSEVIIESREHYQKRSFRNRYHIGSHQGMMELSVPLKKAKNNHQLITEVLISYDLDWPGQHWKAIQTSYGRAAYFLYYKDQVRELLFNNAVNLFDLNQASLKFIQDVLQFDLNLNCSIVYNKICDEKYLDLRSAFHLEFSRMYSGLPYYQVYSAQTDFIPGLSFLDLLFHKGPESFTFLQNEYNNICRHEFIAGLLKQK